MSTHGNGHLYQVITVIPRTGFRIWLALYFFMALNFVSLQYNCDCFHYFLVSVYLGKSHTVKFYCTPCTDLRSLGVLGSLIKPPPPRQGQSGPTTPALAGKGRLPLTTSSNHSSLCTSSPPLPRHPRTTHPPLLSYSFIIYSVSHWHYYAFRRTFASKDPSSNRTISRHLPFNQLGIPPLRPPSPPSL